MAETMHERFFDVAARFADRPFVGTPPNPERRWAPEGLVYSYAQAAASIEALARVYRDAGIGHGHRVASVIENHPDFFLHKMALSTLGASIVPLSPELGPAELTWALTLTRPELGIVLPQHRGRLEALTLPRAPQWVELAAFDRGLPGAREPAPEPGPITRDTETLILFTSGTTGLAKGCRYSHDYELALGDWYRSMGGRAVLRPGLECVYNPLPVSHSDCGVRAFHEMMPVGGCVMTSDRFRPARFWQDVVNSKATVLHYLGVVTSMLMARPPSPLDRSHEVRWAIGAGIEPKRHREFEERFGFPLLEVWGMTECMRVLIDSTEPRAVGTRAVGRPRPGLDVRLVDDEDREVPLNTPGELCIRHSAETPRQGVFSGYLQDPEATELAWHGGWFHTGDLLRQDETGLCYFVDRKKHIIRRSGENIAAAEIEALLLAHPAVAQVAAIPVPDEVRGEEVFVCIVPRAGEVPGLALAQRLFQHVYAQLAYYKAPGWVLFLEDLPKTSSQKLKKYAIFPVGVDPRREFGSLDFRAQKQRRDA